MIRCPQCGCEIQSTWDWCEECGFDPEGLKPKGWMPAGTAPGAARPAFGPTAAPSPPPAAPGPAFAPAGAAVAPAAPARAGAGRPPGGPGGPGGPAPTQAGFMPPGYGAAPYAPPGYGPGGPGYPPPKPSNVGMTVLKVVLGIGAAFVLLIVVLIGAVTLLGKNASSKFSSVGSVIDDPVAGSPATTEAPWQRWTSPDSSTSVEFPGIPRGTPPNPPTDGIIFGPDMLYPTAVGQYEFSYSDLTFGRTIPDPAAALSKIGDNVATALSSTDLVRTPSTFVGMPSLEFTGTGSVAGQPVQIHGIAVIAGTRVYLLNTETLTGKPPLDYDRFLNSWRIN